MKNADCFQEGAQGTAREQSYARFAKGEEVMTMIAAAELPNITEKNPDLKYAMFNLPPDDPANAFAYAPAPTGVAVNADTKHPKEAKIFLEYLASEGPAAKYAKIGGTIAPAAAEGGELPEYMESNLKKFFTEDRVNGVGLYRWEDVGIQEQFLSPGILGLFTGQKTVEEILADLDREWGATS